MTTVKQIKDALAEAGITGLKITLFEAGAVVNDGAYLSTYRPQRLLSAAESLVEDGTAGRLCRTDGEDQAALYTEFCRRACYLARGSAEDRALHERVVQEWREENPGSEGSWS